MSRERREEKWSRERGERVRSGGELRVYRKRVGGGRERNTELHGLRERERGVA